MPEGMIEMQTWLPRGPTTCTPGVIGTSVGS